MLPRRARLGLVVALGLGGCVGPGLEPPNEASDRNGHKHADAGAEPVVGPPNTQEGGQAQDAGQGPADAGLENADAASDSSMDDDAGE